MKPKHERSVTLCEADNLQIKLEAFMEKKLTFEELSVFKNILERGAVKTHQTGSGIFKNHHYDLEEISSFLQDELIEHITETPITWSYKGHSWKFNGI